MFNVYLPKLLETRRKTDVGPPKTLEDTMWDVVIFTLGGCPGAIVRFTDLCIRAVCLLTCGHLFGSIPSSPQLGAYLIQSPLGRRLSLSFSTLTTAAFCVLFVAVESRWAVRASTVGISLSATVSYFAHVS
jgi:hypothetical protein